SSLMRSVGPVLTDTRPARLGHPVRCALAAANSAVISDKLDARLRRRQTRKDREDGRVVAAVIAPRRARLVAGVGVLRRDLPVLRAHQLLRRGRLRLAGAGHACDVPGRTRASGAACGAEGAVPPAAGALVDAPAVAAADGDRRLPAVAVHVGAHARARAGRLAGLPPAADHARA